MFLDGRVRLFLGDCRQADEAWDHAISAVVTDPPYGIGETAGGPASRARQKGAYTDAFKDDAQYVAEVCAPIISQCIAAADHVAVTPGRTNLWFYPPAADVGCFYQPAATGVSFWGRPTWQPILFYGTAPNRGEQLRPLHYVLTEAAEANGHPYPKPIGAWRWLVNKSTAPNDIVFDPFMGSGTTGVACIQLGRRFVGVEIEPQYFDIACRRVAEATRQGTLFPPHEAEQINMDLRSEAAE